MRRLPRIRVEWREGPHRRTRSWPDEPEGETLAVRFARRVAGGFIGSEEPLTIDGLWALYRATEFPDLRPATRRAYEYCWRDWRKLVGGHYPAGRISARHVDQLRFRVRRAEEQPGRVRRIYTVVRLVYRWAHARGLLLSYPFENYRLRLPRSGQPSEPAEYRLEEARSILAQFDPASRTQWRPWAILNLVIHQGIRATACLHLRWADVDFEAGVIVWPAQFDKLGRTWRQPIRVASLRSFEVARRERGASLTKASGFSSRLPVVGFRKTGSRTR